jgi:chemotaxis response regulator CheB
VKDFSVLIAVQPHSFERLIEHVLDGQPDIRVVLGSSKRDSAVAKAARLAPDVIIVSTRHSGRERGDVLTDLKRSSPASTMILLTHGPGALVPRRDADACLPEEEVVRRLLPVIRKAVDRVRGRAPKPAPAGGCT